MPPSDRQRLWQDGVWVDSTVVITGAAAMPVFGGGAIAVPLTGTVYVLESPQMRYIGLWRKQKGIPMTVNAPVRFALEKDKLYVVGEDGKEYELKLTKKILKTDQ